MILFQATVDPLFVRSYGRFPNETEYVIHTLMHSLENEGWVNSQIELEYVTVENVFHIDQDNQKHKVCFVKGMPYILMPLDSWSVMAMVILREAFPKIYKDNCATYFISDLSSGVDKLVDATERLYSEHSYPRFSLKKAVTTQSMIDVHESYCSNGNFHGLPGLVGEKFREFRRIQKEFKPFIEASLDHECQWIVLSILVSSTNISVPDRYKGHFGVDTGDLQLLTNICNHDSTNSDSSDSNNSDSSDSNDVDSDENEESFTESEDSDRSFEQNGDESDQVEKDSEDYSDSDQSEEDESVPEAFEYEDESVPEAVDVDIQYEENDSNSVNTYQYGRHMVIKGTSSSSDSEPGFVIKTIHGGIPDRGEEEHDSDFEIVHDHRFET